MILRLLQKHTLPIGVLAAAALVLYFVIAAWGQSLGMDPEFRSGFLSWSDRIWKGLTAILAVLLARDSDGDGIPDVLDADAPQDRR